MSTIGADKLLEEIDSNKNNHNKLQRTLEDNKELIEKIIQENPNNASAMREIVDTVTHST